MENNLSTLSLSPIQTKAPWLFDESLKDVIKPYVYMREENHIAHPGSLHSMDWFKENPLFKEALSLDELSFGEAILNLENKAFGADLAMPRWVFYDCALVPGFVCGFAMKKSALPQSYIDVLGPLDPYGDWIPLSLFIVIPTIHKGEWVAHNLCAINSLVPEKDRLYGLGFLTKAFGLWYANVETCVGMTQWGKPALKLHSHFGHIEIITAYTPIHTYARTLTYRCRVKTSVWEQFFSREDDFEFLETYEPSPYQVDPKDEKSMVGLQKKIESKEGPFFLSPREIAEKKINEPLVLYRVKGKYGVE